MVRRHLTGRAADGCSRPSQRGRRDPDALPSPPSAHSGPGRSTLTAGDCIIQRVAILGAGGWGTALAVHLARVGHDARLWGRDASLVADMRVRQVNAVYLPDIRFPARLRVTADMAAALDGAEVVVMAVPSHGTRDIARVAAPFVDAGRDRGQRDQGARAAHALPRVRDSRAGAGRRRARWRCVSGPSFASELARELPTAVSVASRDERGGGGGAGGVPRAVLPPLRHERRGRASRSAARSRT